MLWRRPFLFLGMLCLSALAIAQDTAPVRIVANDNRVAAGTLDNGVLNVALEIRNGIWHAEAEDGPPLFVPAFAEMGKPAQIPGPMMRVRENTTVHARITNKLDKVATVYGFDTRPGDKQGTGIEIKPGETYDVTFNAGSPGTYFYWAATEPPVLKDKAIVRPFIDAQLSGAFIVDPPGPVSPDRIFVINAMFDQADAIHPTFEVATINGKEYPYTEPLEYTQGEAIHWRVINPSFGEHPMHLHGNFFRVLSLGTSETDTSYAPADQQTVVTQDMKPGQTMLMEWAPQHAGRWLFHCHFHAHISTDERVPQFAWQKHSVYGDDGGAGVSGATVPHDPMGSMHDMAGLLLLINVKPNPAMHTERTPQKARKLQLVLDAGPNSKSKTLSCSLHEGIQVATSSEQSMGPPMVLERGQPVEVTVVNHLKEATTIHWHGIVLDSYYDGVMGGGMGDQVTPSIPPGGSFVARFTPDRAGTFIYHTHAPNPEQLSMGVYGALIVLAPGQKYDAVHDKLLVLGTRDATFDAKKITVNGSETFPPMQLNPGETYRLRVINMAANLPGRIELGSKENPVQWREIGKDGTDVPARLNKWTDAQLDIASGETYDFEVQPKTAGEIPVCVTNRVNGAKLEGKIVVQDGTAVASAK